MKKIDYPKKGLTVFLDHQINSET